MHADGSTDSIIRNNAVLCGLSLAIMVYRPVGDCDDFLIVDINGSAESIEKVDREEIIGRKLTEVFPGAREFGIFKALADVWRTGIPEHIDVKRYKDDRIDGWRENDIIRLETGEVSAIYTDRTDQRIEELSHRNSEKTYRDIIATSFDGFIMIDRTGHLLETNPSFQKLVEYEAEELKGMDIHSLVPEMHKEMIDRVVRIPKTRRHASFEAQMIGRSGKPIDIAINANRSKDGASAYCFIRDISERIKKETELRYIGYHDRLTDLFNRAFFEEEVKRLDHPRQYPISFIMADINGLKFANDAFGHGAGDGLLVNFAKVMKSCLRTEDIAARWGGDEFVILLPKTPNDVARSICDRIISMVNDVREGPLSLSVALGSSTKSDVGQPFDIVIKDAEDMMYQNKLLNVRSVRNQSIASLLRTMREMNYETEEHEQRLLDTATNIGHSLHLMQQEIEELRLLAIMHDVGKLGVSKEIIMKPKCLTPEEWAEMKRHSEIGYRIAESIQGLAHISKYILSIHENWDGTGYPKGLRGNAIPKLSRIIAIADAYDEMIIGRPYRPAITSDQAIQELMDCKDTQFDPDLVDLFIAQMAIDT